jgi:hypothetical protein
VGRKFTNKRLTGDFGFQSPDLFMLAVRNLGEEFVDRGQFELFADLH